MDQFAAETPNLVGADLLISLSDFLGDLVLLYRCWVIWNKNLWVVLLPLLTATAGFGESSNLANAFPLRSVRDPDARRLHRRRGTLDLDSKSHFTRATRRDCPSRHSRLRASSRDKRHGHRAHCH